MSPRKLCLLGTCAALASVVHADPNDFVNPKYVVAARSDPATSGARSTIIRSADTSAKKGPWTVTDTSIRAPTNDPHDYLSWAPYHWPECNWCGQTRSSNDKPPPHSESDDDSDKDNGDDDNDNYGQGKKKAHTAYENETSEGPPADDRSNPSPEAPMLNLPPLKRQTNSKDPANADTEPHSGLGLFNMAGDVFGLSGSMKEPTSMVESLSVVQTNVVTKVSASPLGADLRPTITVANSLPLLDTTNAPTLNSDLPTYLATLVGEPSLVVRGQFAEALGHIFSTEIATTTASGTPQASTSHLESIAHTTSQAPDPTALPLRGKKGKTASSCTPSPTTSMPPSATWTTCPYKTRDGRVNPDVRQLKNAAELVDMSQASIWNAVAAVSSGSKSTVYVKNVVSFIDTFFLNDATKMKPNVEYGQVVRGPPGTQEGTYMGVLDFRGMVKLVNAILVLREMKSQEWTTDRDVNMNAWAKAYVQWVEKDPVGKKAAKAANNHGSFYPNQIAAFKVLMGDMNGARTVLQSYFANQFQEQIVGSGEQPLEAVRTRPFHYRCFNLEAVITNAKLGDYLGMNFWTYKTKYGATIQTAVNYLMTLDPGKEKVADALPLVAAVAAAYGDPQGKYATYLKAGNKNYAKKPFWFYNQPGAITRGQAAKHRQHQRDEPSLTSSSQASPTPSPHTQDIDASDVDQDHPPILFSEGRIVELEEGFFVGWDDVRQFYRRLERRRIREERRRTRVKRAMPRQAPTPPSMFQDGKEIELEEGEEVSWADVKGFYGPMVSANPA